MRKICFVNPKGGVGKTTSVVNTGAALSRLGRRVLLIDLDPQQHLTYSLGLEGLELKKSIYHLLKGELSFEEVVLHRGELDVIASSANLEELEMKLAYIKKDDLLKNSLKYLSGYDYLLIDCPPNLNILTINAMLTANEIFVPIQTEFLALQGMGRLLKVVRELKKNRNTLLKVSGIIATRYDERKRLNNDVIKTIVEYFDDKLFKTFIHENIDIAVAPSNKQTIFELKSRSRGAKDYLSLAEEIVLSENAENMGQKEENRSRPESFVELIKKDLKRKN